MAIKETTAKMIKDNMTFEFNFADFFDMYCERCGIDDPENILTDEEYEKLESRCEEKITYRFLQNVKREIMSAAMNVLFDAMSGLHDY